MAPLMGGAHRSHIHSDKKQMVPGPGRGWGSGGVGVSRGQNFVLEDGVLEMVVVMVTQYVNVLIHYELST